MIMDPWNVEDLDSPRGALGIPSGMCGFSPGVWSPQVKTSQLLPTLLCCKLLLLLLLVLVLLLLLFSFLKPRLVYCTLLYSLYLPVFIWGVCFLSEPKDGFYPCVSRIVANGTSWVMFSTRSSSLFAKICWSKLLFGDMQFLLLFSW